MSKEKKRRNLKKNFSEKTEGKNLGKENTDLRKDNLSGQIKNAVEGLNYMSETDAEVLPFIGEKAEAVSKEAVLSQSKSAVGSPVEEKDFTAFFARLTEIQDWFGEEETAMAKKFTQLKELLEKNLRDLKVYKIGKIELDVYVVGLDAESNLLGIKTKAVET